MHHLLLVVVFFAGINLSLSTLNASAIRATDSVRDSGWEIEKWKTNLTLINFNQEQRKKIREAEQIIKKIITTQKFRNKIFNYQFQGKKAFNNNKGLSNQEIYQKIIEGIEKKGHQQKDHSMDMIIELFYEKTKTIGYTYPHTKKVWINNKYFSQYDATKIADNLVHEWMHKLGFEHDYKWNKDREHSVPYAVGYIIEELALEEFLETKNSQVATQQFIKKQDKLLSSSKEIHEKMEEKKQQ